MAANTGREKAGTVAARALTRRNFLYLTGLAATGVVATACGGGEPLPGQTPQQPQATAAAQPTAAPTQAQRAIQPTIVAQQTPVAAPARYKEAPQFAQLVKDGKLPPVEQRVPKNPIVLAPVEKVGKWGGTWRMGLVGGQDTAWLVRTLGNEHLVRWDPTWSQVIPNVAETFQASPDAKEYTFKLREGIKWSDGQPYTADDLVFYNEDIHKNKDLTATRGRFPSEVVKIDQHTVKITFEQPRGLFLQELATPGGDAWTRYPAHYLKQFHQKYNTTNLDQLAQQAGAKDWVELFRLKGAGIPGTPYDARWQNPDLPSLNAWRITTPYGANVTRVVAERNPFYYKVDSEGNQLPYIDRLVYDVAQDAQVLVLKALNGEIDMQDRHIATNTNKAVLADNQQRGQYNFYETVPAGSNVISIALNLTHKDPTKRQIFQNRDFRIGLSHAINRQAVIDVVFVGQGEPWQVAPRKDSPFYNEKLATQYLEFDQKRANEFLDKVLPRKDGEGFRLGPDGKRFSFVVEVTGQPEPVLPDIMQLVEQQWRQVGVDVQVKNEERSLLYTRKNANEHDAVVWGGSGGLGYEIILDPRHYFPFSDESNFAQAWSIWYNPGGNPRTQPEEPPAAPKQQIELYRQLEAAADPAKQQELMKQILNIAQEQFWLIGISLPTNGYGLVKNNMKNVPKSMPGAWLWPTPNPSNPPQYFFE
jgi:peptide/nickel transport system substrate-binding protein